MTTRGIADEITLENLFNDEIKTFFSAKKKKCVMRKSYNDDDDDEKFP